MAATGWQRRGAGSFGDCLAKTALGLRSRCVGEHVSPLLRNALEQARLSPEKESRFANRLTKVDIPNGMHTKYTYDTSGRQESIHHKDGATVKQGFDYTFPPSADLRHGGQITRIDHEDGSYWEYDYDGRDRLVEAERYDNTPTLLHRYTYTYPPTADLRHDGGNMATKAVYDPSGPTTVTTTFTYNDANELTNTNDGATSIDMTYDEWGRLVEKDDGTYTATYAYRYGSKLYSVTSNFPG